MFNDKSSIVLAGLVLLLTLGSEGMSLTQLVLIAALCATLNCDFFRDGFGAFSKERCCER